MDPQDLSQYLNKPEDLPSYNTVQQGLNHPPQRFGPVHQQGLMNPTNTNLLPDFNPRNASPAGSGGVSGFEPERRRGRPNSSSTKDRKQRGRPRKETVVDVPHLHSIDVNPGEDIVSAIGAFTRQQPPGTTVSVISALGSINSGTLNPNGNFHGEGTIISMSGAFQLSQTNMLTGRLIMSLLTSDGRVVAGNVTGALIASSPVTVVVMISYANGKGSKSTPPPSKKSRLGASPSSSTPLLL